MTEHHDFFGTPLEVGAKVGFMSHSRSSSSLNWGTVTGETPCFVKVRANGDREDTKVSPEKVVVKPHD